MIAKKVYCEVSGRCSLMLIHPGAIMEYRTNTINENYPILNTIIELKSLKKQNAIECDGVFGIAPQVQKISNNFRDDLLIFNELIRLYELQYNDPEMGFKVQDNE